MSRSSQQLGPSLEKDRTISVADFVVELATPLPDPLVLEWGVAPVEVQLRSTQYSALLGQVASSTICSVRSVACNGLLEVDSGGGDWVRAGVRGQE